MIEQGDFLPDQGRVCGFCRFGSFGTRPFKQCLSLTASPNCPTCLLPLVFVDSTAMTDPNNQNDQAMNLQIGYDAVGADSIAPKVCLFTAKGPS